MRGLLIRLATVAKYLRNANISVTGQNLFTITDYTGFDPEVNVDKNIGGIPSLGIEYIPYPVQEGSIKHKLFIIKI